jgi:hypothetical protein
MVFKYSSELCFSHAFQPEQQREAHTFAAAAVAIYMLCSAWLGVEKGIRVGNLKAKCWRTS